MSVSGGASKSKQQSTSTSTGTATTTPNTPGWIAGPWEQYVSDVNDWSQSGAPLAPGPAPLQTQAFGAAEQLTSPVTTGAPTAQGIAQNVAAAGPNLAGTQFTGGAPVAYSSDIPSTDISAYMNPYLGLVAGTYARDFDANAGRARAQQASAAALSGGARNSNNAIGRGVLEGELARARGSGIASILDQGYNTAAQLATADLNRAAGTSQFNAGLGANMAQFDAGQQDNSLMRQLQAAGLIGDLGLNQSADNRANISLQAQLGQIQRDITGQNSEAARLAAVQALLAGVPLEAFIGQTKTGTETTNSKGSGSQFGLGFTGLGGQK